MLSLKRVPYANRPYIGTYRFITNDFFFDERYHRVQYIGNYKVRAGVTYFYQIRPGLLSNTGFIDFVDITRSII